MLGRGCPFECTYCCNHAIKHIAAGPYVRFRSPNSIVNEIREITVRFPARKDIYLEVESFGINKQWAFTLCDKLKDFNSGLKIPLTFSVNIRVIRNADFAAIFAALKKANFRLIQIGLESGSEASLRLKMLNRDYFRNSRYYQYRKVGKRLRFKSFIP